MKKIIALFLMISMLGSGCQSDAPSTKDQKQNTNETTTQQRTTAKAFPMFPDMLSQSNMVEFVFYVPEGSLSTEFDNQTIINNFNYYISPQTTIKYDCPYEGGAVFRKDGDITMEMDLVLSEKCRHAKIKIGDQYYYHEISEAGLKYFNSLANIRQGQGQPIPK